MNHSKLDKIINLIKEQMVASASPTGPAGFSRSAPAAGPVAGTDPVMGFTKKRKKIIGLGQKSRKRWMKP
jgi:hypothetical protein